MFVFFLQGVPSNTPLGASGTKPTLAQLANQHQTGVPPGGKKTEEPPKQMPQTDSNVSS